MERRASSPVQKQVWEGPSVGTGDSPVQPGRDARLSTN